MNLLFSFMFLATLTGIPLQTTSAVNNIYVSPGATGTTCLESDPCSLQQGASIAKAGAFIYVEEGTYYAIPTTPTDEVVKFSKFVIVLGSCVFDGIDATPPVCGQDAPHRSIIDGQNAHRGITLVGNSTTPPNLYMHHLDVINGEADEVDLSTCTVNLGYTRGGCGGGLFIESAGIIYINDFRFENNYAANLSTTSAGFGGAIYIEDTWDVTITNTEFINNRASWSGTGFGGGIFATDIGNQIIVEDSTFTGNYCTATDATSSTGCGAMLHASEGVIFQKNTFTNNNPFSNTLIKGSALFFLNNHDFTVDRNYFTMNKGISALGASNGDNARPDKISANKFVDNHATNLIQYEGKYWVKIINNMLTHRLTTRETDEQRGGPPPYTTINLSSNALAPLKSIANIYHNSIARSDVGMQIRDNFFLYVRNNIITWCNVQGISVATPNNMGEMYSNNLFYQNTIDGLGPDPTNIFRNPNFFNYPNDLHIHPNSPAIDKGSIVTGVFIDFDGNPRPNSGYDIGADEAYGFFHLPLILR